MARFCTPCILGVLIAVGLCLAALPARASMSVGVGFSTGNVGVGFSTYAPLSMFERVYTSSSGAVHFGYVHGPRYIRRSPSRPVIVLPAGSEGKLRKTPRPSPRVYRGAPPPPPPGYYGYGRSGSFGNRGYPPRRYSQDTPRSRTSRGYGGYPVDRHASDWKRTPPPPNAAPYFGERYQRHFSAPGFSRPDRPAAPYPGYLPPSGHRPFYREGPRFSGSFVLEP